MKNRIYYWFPVILWAGVIFFLSSKPVAPSSAVDWQDFLIKKTAHVIEYAILYLFVYRAVKNSLSQSLSKTKIALFSLLVVVLYAVTDEYHQTFVFGRTGRLRDVLIDMGGGVPSWLIIVKLLPKAPPKLKNLVQKLQVI